jgi:hypothetical protein
MTQAPDRPGANPGSRPTTVGSAFMNDVIHGSAPRQLVLARIHRTDRALVSSIKPTGSRAAQILRPRYPPTAVQA